MFEFVAYIFESYRKIFLIGKMIKLIQMYRH